MNHTMRNQIKLSHYFWAYELECPCCARLLIRPQLLNIMDKIRGDHGLAIKPTSWCRCLVHNADVYAQKQSPNRRLLKVNTTSPHIIGNHKGIIGNGGWAVDFPVVWDGVELDDREAWLQAIGVIGAGFGPNFTHIDIKPRKVKFRSWIYNEGKATRRTVVES